MKIRLFAFTLLWCGASVLAQDYFPENDGVKSKNNNYTAFTNAKIFVTPSTRYLKKAPYLSKMAKWCRWGKK